MISFVLSFRDISTRREDGMKIVTLALIFVMASAVSGCAQKSASEQLRDDMKKAGKQMEKDYNKMVN